MTQRIALIAALPRELRPLVRGWEKRGDLFLGRIGTTGAVAIAAGMGTSAAARACERVLRESGVEALVSIGYAGSVSCGLQTGNAYAIREVIDAATAESFPTDTPKGQRLITLSSVAGPQEKRQLAAQYQAVMVDMEAAAVARIARANNLGFFCFKAVTDGPNDKLPDFNRFTSPQGEWSMTPFLAYLALHPQYWSAMRRLAKISRKAAEELANFLERFFAGSQ